MSEWSYLSFKCNVSKQQHPMWVFIYNVNEMVRRHLVFSCTNLLCEGIPRVFSFKHFKWGHQRLKNDMLMFRVLVWSYLCLKIFYWFAGDEWNVKSPWIKLATRCRTKKKRFVAFNLFFSRSWCQNFYDPMFHRIILASHAGPPWRASTPTARQTLVTSNNSAWIITLEYDVGRGT